MTLITGSRYQQPKKFFPVFDGTTGQEGTVWQDSNTMKIFVTWLMLGNNKGQITKEVVPGTGHGYLVAAAGNGYAPP